MAERMRERSFDLRPLPWRLILNIGLVSLTFGYIRGTEMTGVGGSVSPYTLFAIVEVAVLAMTLWTNVFKRQLNLAWIYRAVMACTVAAFLATPYLNSVSLAGWSSAVVTACYDCFDMVAWLIITNIASLTSASPLVTFGCGRLSNHAGMLVGVFLGMAVNSWSKYYLEANQLASTLITFALVLCILCASREIGFFSTPPKIVNKMANTDSTFHESCELVARQFGLTERETQVLELLARGRNAAYISETLVISSNTAKTHSKRIYRKLGVNSQQQLMDLVDEQINKANPWSSADGIS